MRMREKGTAGRRWQRIGVREWGRGHAAAPTPHGGMPPHDGRGRGGHRLGRPCVDPGPATSGRFPRDHRAREGYKTEWWYFTGLRRTVEEPVRRFGYQFTFFRIGVSQDALRSGSAWAAKDIIMGHAALTDLDTGRHRFSELVVRAAPLPASFGWFAIVAFRKSR